MTDSNTSGKIQPTQEELDKTEVVRVPLIKLGRAIMDDQPMAEAIAELEALGVKLSATTAISSPGYVMIVAHYGRCRLPIDVMASDPEGVASKFPLYENPIDSSKP